MLWYFASSSCDFPKSNKKDRILDLNYDLIGSHFRCQDFFEVIKKYDRSCRSLVFKDFADDSL